MEHKISMIAAPRTEGREPYGCVEVNDVHIYRFETVASAELVVANLRRALRAGLALQPPETVQVGDRNNTMVVVGQHLRHQWANEWPEKLRQYNRLCLMPLSDKEMFDVESWIRSSK